MGSSQSIYSHEQEHALMAKQGANEALCPVYTYPTTKPDAIPFGKGLCVEIDSAGTPTLYCSNGSSWVSSSGNFTPSIYSGLKSATTTVTGQSEAIATGATKLQVINKDATNGAYIGLGSSASAAETACSSGVAGQTKFLLLAEGQAMIPLTGYSHYAWLGVGGTVSLRVTQGV